MDSLETPVFIVYISSYSNFNLRKMLKKERPISNNIGIIEEEQRAKEIIYTNITVRQSKVLGG